MTYQTFTNAHDASKAVQTAKRMGQRAILMRLDAARYEVRAW